MSANAAPKIRVAIVDDSSFVRAALQRIIDAEARFEVIGQASDGRSAIALVEKLRPDVVTMDYNMPGMAGDEVVRRILAAVPTPIVMVSAHTTEGAEATVAALAAGAIDVVAKPGGEVSMNLAQVSGELLAKLAIAARSHPRPSSISAPSAAAPAPPHASASSSSMVTDRLAERVVVIGASTGGPAALDALVRALPSSTYGVMIVQHMATSALTTAFAARLASVSPLRVRQAVDGDRLRAGLALVAPGGRHLTFVAGGAVRLNDDPPVHGVRPAVDLAMKSAASCFGARAIGVVLTGMGRDGALGLAAIKSAGGRTFAQDQATSVVFGMPRAAIELGVVDEVAPLEGLAKAIARALSR
ncbi:MAG: chemotaxis-specific protein-glutamate methyltransferase CheB [Polyangiales bacterium]